MKTLINYQRVTVPEAFIAQSRQRVKQYGSTVYLKNGDEFQIELFNPTQSKVLAKIKINGTYISSSGIVLRPGERVFLERYLDEAKKFLFEIYEVNGSDYNVREAIKNNGDVEVEFYEQYYQNQYTTITWQPSTYTWYSGTSYVQQPSSCYTSSVLNEQSIETGRVERGEYSNQSFGTDYSTYNSYYSWKSEWKILPNSQKPIMKENLVVYCTGCGAKRKKSSHKFCPHCGSRY